MSCITLCICVSWSALLQFDICEFFKEFLEKSLAEDGSKTIPRFFAGREKQNMLSHPTGADSILIAEPVGRTSVF